MKKLLLASAILFMAGCADKVHFKTMEFVGQNDASYNVKLLSADDFDTAVLHDNRGHELKLKNVVTGSGTRLADENGAQIQFKKGEGILNLSKDSKDIFLKAK